MLDADRHSARNAALKHQTGKFVSDNPVLRVLRAIARFVVTIAVVIYTLLDELLFPLVRPLLRWLGDLKLFQKLGAWIAGLPPYVVLVLLAVPFILIEPAKVFAVYWTATGHVIQGAILLLIAQIVSLLTCERIFHVGHDKLMQIGWFKRLMTWLFGLRDKALNWAKSSKIWQSAAEMIKSVRTWFRGLIASLR
jgi:hypothetical protein